MGDIKIGFQSFNVASENTILNHDSAKHYELDENKKFKNELKKTMEENDFVFLGLQETRKQDTFLSQYKKCISSIVPKQKVQNQVTPLKIQKQKDITLLQKVVKKVTNFFGFYKNVKLFGFKTNSRENRDITLGKQRYCKGKCGFSINDSSFKGVNILSFKALEVPIIIINTHLFFSGKRDTDFGLKIRYTQFNQIFDYLSNDIAFGTDLENNVIIMMGDLNFRFYRDFLLISENKDKDPFDPLDQEQLSQYMKKYYSERFDPSAKCFDELCSILSVKANEGIKEKIFNQFSQNLKKTGYPITCAFNTNSIDQKDYKLEKKGVKRDPSNCDKLLYYIPEQYRKRVLFNFTPIEKRTIRVKGSDHLFMNFGSLVIKSEPLLTDL